MTTSTESFVRITYTTPENELTAAQKAARERFLLQSIWLSSDFTKKKRQGRIAPVAIELYPCE
jgi:hypothetical protein